MMLAVAAIASCKKPDPEPGPGPGPSNDPVLKVTLPSSGPLSVYRWAASDEIRVGEGVFKLKDGAGTATATFDGTPAKDSYYTIAYPADIKGTDTYLAYSLSGQVQEGNGDAKHLIWTALIEDASTWEDITFSKEWATSKSASFRSNGVVAMNLTLPSDIGALKSITLEASGIKFPVNNSGTSTADALVLGLKGVSASAAVKAYLAVSEKEVNIPAEGLRLTVEGDIIYNVLVPQAVNMGGGILTEITVSDASAWSSTAPLRGEGTEASPYILSAPEHIEEMASLLEEDKTVWFELGDDIDMSYIVDWDPLNIIAPYNLAVHFDGKGHKISNFKCASGIYPSFFGVLNGTVQNVVFDNAEIDGSGKAGVVAGYIGTVVEGVKIVGNVIGVTVQNSSVKTDNYAGGIGGQIYSAATISDCHVKDVIITSSLERVGGLIGQAGVSSEDVGASIKNCTAENVTAEAQKNIGGLIGVTYCKVSGCTASGRLTSNLASNKEVSVGGLIGHVENTTVSDCSASTVVELTLQGRSIGGFVGTFKAGKIERCFATGEIIGTYRNNGGFVGLIQTSAASATIENCYCTGDVSSQSYIGGFVGLVDGTSNDAIIKNCYSSGNVVGTSFDVGGFVGHEGCAVFQALNCAAWAKTVTAGVFGAANWSSGAFCAVTFPTCTIKGCYRNPEMVLTAYWVPDANYDHPDVSPTSPLVKQDGKASTATALASGQDGYPQFAYHGHVAPGKTLSQLASTTLGWDASVWDFSGELPVLKK
jgi:hypothetical protein